MSSTGQAIRDPFFDRSHRLIAQLFPVQRQRRHGCAPGTSSPGQGFQNPRRNGGLSIRETIHQLVELCSGRCLHRSNLAHPFRPDPMVPGGKRRRKTGGRPARNAPHARSGATPMASMDSCSTHLSAPLPLWFTSAPGVVRGVAFSRQKRSPGILLSDGSGTGASLQFMPFGRGQLQTKMGAGALAPTPGVRGRAD